MYKKKQKSISSISAMGKYMDSLGLLDLVGQLV